MATAAATSDMSTLAANFVDRRYLHHHHQHLDSISADELTSSASSSSSAAVVSYLGQPLGSSPRCVPPVADDSSTYHHRHLHQHPVTVPAVQSPQHNRFSPVSPIQHPSASDPDQLQAFSYQPVTTASASSSSDMQVVAAARSGCRFYATDTPSTTTFPVTQYGCTGALEAARQYLLVDQSTSLSFDSASQQPPSACRRGGGGYVDVQDRGKYEPSPSRGPASYYPAVSGGLYRTCSPSSSSSSFGEVAQSVTQQQQQQQQVQHQLLQNGANVTSLQVDSSENGRQVAPFIKTYKWMTVKRGPPRTTTGMFL